MTDTPLRILVVDDEEPARRRLRDLLEDCAAVTPLTVIGEAATGRAALELLSTQPADVVLLDIRMPEMDGIELAQHLQKLEQRPAVIFTTAFDVYAIRAFEVHAIDYLLKPIPRVRLQEALTRARATRPPLLTAALDRIKTRARAFLCAQERGRITLVPVEDVIYLRAELKYVTVRTARGEFLIEESLTRLEEEYGERFVRVHRNCLVARAAILGFERAATDGGEIRWVVLLRDCEERLAVSRRQQYVMREISQ